MQTIIADVKDDNAVVNLFSKEITIERKDFNAEGHATIHEFAQDFDVYCAEMVSANAADVQPEKTTAKKAQKPEK